MGCVRRIRLYAEEGLAGTEVAVWVAEDGLTVEYGGQALSRYEVLRAKGAEDPTLPTQTMVPNNAIKEMNHEFN